VGSAVAHAPVEVVVGSLRQVQKRREGRHGNETRVAQAGLEYGEANEVLKPKTKGIRTPFANVVTRHYLMFRRGG